MKRITLLKLLTLFLFSCLVACNFNNTDKHTEPNTVNSFSDTTTIQYAKGFTISYHGNYKVLTVLTPWKDAKEQFKYILVQKGTPVPKGYEQNQIIEIPVKYVISLSSLFSTCISTLGYSNEIIGIDSKQWVCDSLVKSRIKTGKITEVCTPALNIEKVMQLQPGLVFAFGGGNPKYDAHPKLLEAGIKVAIVADHQETSPLGRAEWLKFFAAFFNAEKQADSLFSNISKSYNEVKQLTTNVNKHPTVFTSVKYGDIWYMPGGNSFMASILKDAGANYPWANDTSKGTLPLSFETVYSMAAKAQYWLNISDFTSLTEVANADIRYKQFEAFKTGGLWNNNLRLNELGGNDYWNAGMINPQLVLADLIKIFHPELLPQHQFVYYKNLK